MPALRSLDELDLSRSWARVLSWARSRVGDVPDRLQYELLDRVWGGAPELAQAHDVQPVHLVLATKGGHQTVRPFVRAHGRDVLLYWALVDAVAPHIEAALGDADQICANRWTPTTEDVTPAARPNWSSFEERIEALAMADPDGFVLRADVSSFYMVVNLDRLARVLLEVGASGPVVEDLRFLLSSWQAQGIRGLPQGIPASGPLANIYMKFADEIVADSGSPFVRYSDDLAVFCSSFREGRSILDRLERRMYDEGLTLGGEKTRILRSATLVERLRPGPERERRAMAKFAGDYDWDETEISEAEHGIALEAFDSALTALADDRYERSEFIWSFRRLGRFGDPHALPSVANVLTRMPGLTGEAMAYVTKMGPDDRAPAMLALEAALEGGFHRDQEWLHILRALTIWDGPCSAGTIERLARVSREHSHPLVRARAMLAWCRQSGPDESDVAEVFFLRERRIWKPWAVAAVRDKARRDDLWARWRGEGRSVSRVIDSLSAQPLGWHKN